MFRTFGWAEALLIFGILLLFFGATRLPKVADSIGQSINAFKKGLRRSGDSEQKGESDTASASKTKNDDSKQITQH